jgi:hypothetical protein
VIVILQVIRIDDGNGMQSTAIANAIEITSKITITSTRAEPRLNRSQTATRTRKRMRTRKSGL